MASIYTQRVNSFNATSSSNTIFHKYDVFLSFRGEDTRGNFLEYLYRALRQKGILTFKDDDKLKDGEDIKDGLLKAIEESSFSIVVLSLNYASSSWCLDELVQILNCKRTTGHVVYPVFYHVEPTEVRKIKGEFGKGFAKAASGNEEKVEKWTEALCEVVDSKGWAYPGTRFENEAELIDDLVQKIFMESIKMYRIPAEDLVGIRYPMMEVIKLLDLGSDKTQVLGLWGMGGIGKTTLAKVVYDSISSQFESCSFVDNVREVFNKSGVLALQEHLITDILMEKDCKIRSVIHGTSIIQNRVCRKKVLIVLDDVSEPKQLENLVVGLHWFSRGSRIIITTRNQQVLNVCGAQNVFNVQELDECEATELFKSKAFANEGEAEEKFQRLIGCAVNYAKGVPLALKVLGSSLLGGTVPEWESALARLSISPDDELQQVLRISYDGLHWMEKEIFLDISCFFKGVDIYQVIKILDGCDFNPVVGINALVKKSLLTISVDDKFLMHDLVQKMGWFIVNEESRKEPGERSRLWRPKEVKDVLMDNMGTKKIEAICVDLENLKISIRPDAFSKMINLRALMINGAWISIDPPNKLQFLGGYLLGFLNICGARGSIDLPNKLRLLVWDRYPLNCMPSTFQPEHLVSLALTNNCIKQLWDRTMVLPKLTFLNLKNSMFLTKCPDFSGFPNLEILVLTGCTALVDVHPSIKNLKKVVSLSLEGCCSLQTFPSGIESQYLRSLVFSGCLKLNNNLECFEHLEGISVLRFDRTGITELHHSIGNCTNLCNLDLTDCKQLESIPKSIGQLRKLTHLSLSRCFSLCELPEEVGDIDSLELLDVSSSGVRQLPQSVARLRNLQRLRCLQYQGTPPCFSGFKSLIQLNLSFGCLNAIPESISFCLSLKELYLSGNGFEYLPKSIKNFSNLEILWINECKRLQELPELPSSIQEVDASNCISLKTICSSTVFRNALYLWFAGCPKLVKNEEIRILMGYKFLSNKMKENILSYGVPGSKVPEWIINQNVGGLVTFHLPILDLKDPNLPGIAFSAVVATKARECTIGLHMVVGRRFFNFGYIHYFPSDSEDVIIILYLPLRYFPLDQLDHMAGKVLEVSFVTTENDLREIMFFESDQAVEPAPEIKECGARLIYSEKIGSSGEMDEPLNITMSLKS